MKIRGADNFGQNKSGNTLLVVLLLMGILTLVMGVYMGLASTENKQVMRSEDWNAALPLAEAGVEEAMSHASVDTNDYSANGWTKITNNTYSKSRTIGGWQYSVVLTGAPNSQIMINSTGSVPWSDGTLIKRAIQVTALSSQFPAENGLVAKSISFGGNLSVDSYDTGDPNHCNPLMPGWYDPTKAQANAFVGNPLTGFTIGGSSHIYGYVAAGPGFSVTTKGAAIVGDLSYSTKGIETGHYTNGFTMSIPDVPVPYTNGITPVTNSVSGTNYTYYLTGAKYYSTNLTSSQYGKSIYVASNSTLYVNGNIDISTIVFGPGNPKLDLYMSQASINFFPTIINAAPPQFMVWCLPSVTSLNMTGGGYFIGVVYAPETTLSGSGNATFYGAIIANAFSCTGTFDFHYDAAAGRMMPPAAIKILSWAEL